MLYGTTVTVTPGGIRVPEEQLKPLGIFHGSRCWGVEVADRHVESRPGATGQTLSHLVIAPFDLDSWPVMFRAELRLRLDRPRAMERAAQILSEAFFNILSIQKAPSGHHHATVAAMGECDGLTRDDPPLAARPAPPYDDDSRRAMRRYIDETFAPVMLAYSRYVEERVLEHNDWLGAHGEDFLRETFVERSGTPGVLYDPQRLPIALDRRFAKTRLLRKLADLKESIRDLGRWHRTPAVRCSWLQNLAFFWLYRTVPEPLSLRFDAASGLLQPDGAAAAARYRDVMEAGMREPVYPFKTVATLDLHEHYLRIVRSPFDDGGETAFVNLEYDMRVAPPTTSRGFQLRVYRRLAASADGPFVVRRVSSGLVERSPTLERGWFHFLVSRAQPGIGIDRSQRERIEGILRAECDAAGAGIRFERRRIAVEEFGARRLFLSTAFDWYDETPRLRTCIETLARRYGFRLVLGRTRGLEPAHHTQTLNTPTGLTRMITDAIDRCQAFLLVLPSHLDDRPTQGRWEFFEMGWAVSRQLPRRICVQLDDVGPSGWARLQEPDFDQELIRFRLADDDQTLYESLEPAFESLSRPARASVGPRD